MELCEDSSNWAQQKVFLVWEKPALNIRLRLKSDGVEDIEVQNKGKDQRVQ